VTFRTPLFDAHRRLGARMVAFAGWEMPIGYGDPGAEHEAVRRTCGLFDVSHMGELRFDGPGAEQLCQRLTTNDVRRLEDGGAQYSVACRADGGVLDDLILYRLAKDAFLAIVNAGHTNVMFDWCSEQAGEDGHVRNESREWALIAVQGPLAVEVVTKLVSCAAASQAAFTITSGSWRNATVWVSRTGYTGEDGFEVLVPADEASPFWSAALEEVLRVGGMPCGLAARDTLRLEAALPLCGSDMDETTTPLQAGLEWVVRFVPGNEFIGREALEREREEGIPRRLVCLEMKAAGVPRQGYEIRRDGMQVGVVTSGARSPTLGSFIGLALVASRHASLGTELDVMIRGRAVPARIVEKPFYRRDRRGKA